MAIFIGVIIYGLLFGFACRYLAKEKNKNETTWFIIGFLLGIIGILLIGFSKSESDSDSDNKNKTSNNITIEDEIRYIDLDCPVDLVNISIISDKVDNRTQCSIRFLNLSSKIISSIKISILSYDSFGAPVEKDNIGYAVIQDLSTKPKTYCNSIISLSNQLTRKVDISISKILFDDNTVWEKGDQEPEKVAINKITNSVEIRDIKRVAGDDAICYPEQRENTWICVCGRINRLDENCIRCGRNKEEVFEKYNKVNIEDKIDSLIKSIRENERLTREKEELEKQEFEQIRKEKIKVLVKSLKVILPICAMMIILVTIGTFTNWSFTYRGYELKQWNRIVNNNGDTLLLQTLQNPNLQALNQTPKGPDPLCNKLIDTGVNINISNNQGKTALELASYDNMPDIVNKLIDKGATGKCYIHTTIYMQEYELNDNVSQPSQFSVYYIVNCENGKLIPNDNYNIYDYDDDIDKTYNGDLLYIGEMKNGAINGTGTSYVPYLGGMCEIYSGEWKNGYFNGQGCSYMYDGSVKNRGTFINGYYQSQ